MVAPSSSALDKILKPLADCLNRESAERVATLQVDAETRGKIDALAVKANEGKLTEAERLEYLDYVEAMDLVGILQRKARVTLAHSTGE